MNRVSTMLRCALFVLPLLVSSPTWGAEPAQAVRVGMTVSHSGEFKDLSEMFERGVRMWMHDLVERGGNPIDLVVYDDESKPAKAAELYEKLAQYAPGVAKS